MRQSTRSHLLSLLLSASLTAASATAYADNPDATANTSPKDSSDVAAQAYRKASQAYEGGDYKRAVNLLEKAYRADPNLIYKYNEILALQALENYDEAIDILDAHQQAMAQDPKKRFANVAKIRRRLEKARDAAAADSSPSADSSPPTDKRAGTTTTATTKIDAQSNPGAKTDLGANRSKSEPTTAAGGPNILGWSLVGVGAAGVGVAALFGSTVLISDVADRRSCIEANGQSSLDQCYPNADDPRSQYQSDSDTWSTHSTITWVSLGVGTAAVVGGTVALLMDGHEANPNAGPSADGAKIRLTPYIGKDGAGGAVGVSF